MATVVAGGLFTAETARGVGALDAGPGESTAKPNIVLKNGIQQGSNGLTWWCSSRHRCGRGIALARLNRLLGSLSAAAGVLMTCFIAGVRAVIAVRPQSKRRMHGIGEHVRHRPRVNIRRRHDWMRVEAEVVRVGVGIVLRRLVCTVQRVVVMIQGTQR